MFIDGSVSDVSEDHIKICNALCGSGPCSVFYDISTIKNKIKVDGLDRFFNVCDLKNKQQIMLLYINGKL